MTFKKGFLAFIIISVTGTIGHFLYEWTGNNFLVGLFFPVSESVWEHLKLLFFPTIIYSVIEYIKCDEKENLICATAWSLFCGMWAIIIFFYTYSGILGYKIDFLNILIYYIAVIITLIKKSKFYNRDKQCKKNTVLFSLGFLALTTLLFLIFSFLPPNIDLFLSP